MFFPQPSSCQQQPTFRFRQNSYGSQPAHFRVARRFQVRPNHVFLLRGALPLLFALLLSAALSQFASAATCSSGQLPNGDGEDLIVSTGTCTVVAGTYHYHNVNIVSGGTLLFQLDEKTPKQSIVFWAASILIENTGSLIAGSAENPIGVNQGTVVFKLYGKDQGTGSPGGQGITCQTTIDLKNNVDVCGIPHDLWVSNSMMKINPGDCTRVSQLGDEKRRLPGNVDDCFYPYMPITYDGGGKTPGFFGYKVIGVSYGGTLQLFGAKGSVKDPQDADVSGTSWARLTTTLNGSKTENSFTINAVVDWKMNDQIVLTTTDYVPGHSEQLTLAADATSSNGVSTITTVEKIVYPHYGSTYSLDAKDVPSDIGPDPGTKDRQVDTRAAVALLSRSIRIVSAGENDNQDFPAESTHYYFGGHTLIRQGFQSVQLRGVEFYQLGQGGRIMHYPVHFHMTRMTPQPNLPTDPPVTFVEDCSVWDSMTRWVTLHGSQGVTIARNVGYKSIGHGFYLEDGTETDNKFYSNIGVFARAAVINPQNPRQVPGILAAAYPDPANLPKKRAQEEVPFHTDIDHPTAFWITNGWNDFEYNMAAGAGTCGACYWFVPAANSTMSRYEKWWSYASEQKWGVSSINPLSRASMSPMQKFVGNTCTSAMNSFNTIGDTTACYGVVRQLNQALPRMLPVTQGALAPDPTNDPAGADAYYPQVDRGGGRFATECPSGYNDCSSVVRCDSQHLAQCLVTVLDHYTTSFSWTETNFAAVWLRPQWYLVSNSAITDAQNGGLTFVTGGGYTESDAIKGHWAIARNDVFIGNVQPATGNPYASNTGPFNPGSLKLDPTFTCAKQQSGATAGNYCLNVNAGISIPISNFGGNQRLFSIYDGPAYEENNAFLDVTHAVLDDCPPQGGNCTASKWMVGQVFGLPKDEKGTCYMPNAAIAWKQPNGFYYPPAFHSNNLYFHTVDIRHFVIEPLFLPGSYSTDFNRVKDRYCTYTPDLFTGYTDVDRQTELNDDDGTLGGLIDTISVNKDSFFNAPFEDIECASDIASNMPPACDKDAETCGTAKSSPYGYVTTVVFPDCGENCPQLDKDADDYLHFWARDCSNPLCYGVPLYRLDINPDEMGTKPSIRMAGQAIAQRSSLTVNHGNYYIDTTVSEARQRKVPNNLINEFKGGHTYYAFLLFAKPQPDDPTKDPPATKQSYQMYVGPGFNPETDVTAVQADIATAPPVFNPIDWPESDPKHKWIRDYNPDTGILTVTLDMGIADFKTNYDKIAEEHCQPRTFCSWSGGSSNNLSSSGSSGSCGCALNSSDPLFSQCQAVCSEWTNKEVPCPDGGCYGVGVAFPANFVAKNQYTPPDPICYLNTPDWDVPFKLAGSNAGACEYKSVPQGVFCSNQPKSLGNIGATQ